jgi:hypothetical protein
MAIILLALPSCRSHKYCSDALRAVQDSSALFSVARSVDTIYRHDSVYVREVQRGDTIYLTRVEYRDRWHTRLVHDTICNTQYIEKLIEHPPERYVPKFYKWCTIALWAIGLLAIGYGLLRWWL